MCVRTQLLRKMSPIPLAFLLFVDFMIFLYSLTLWNTFSFLTRSVQLIFSSTTFQTIPDISELLSEVCSFQHSKILCFQCSSLLVFSLDLSPVCSRKKKKVFFLFNAVFAMAILYLISRVHLVLIYHGTKTFEIFHILQLFMIYHNH
jgi:hypothetical protein